MSRAIAWSNHTAPELHLLVAGSRDDAHAWRLLALVLALKGGSHTQAAGSVRSVPSTGYVSMCRTVRCGQIGANQAAVKQTSRPLR